MVHLKGITWAHSRGLTPVVATAQRFNELYPDISITWEARSLHDFGGAPIDKLAKNYDLIILDHPWMGFADANAVLEPLESWLSQEFIEDQKNRSVGKSTESYIFNNHIYGLAVDAACPISFYSPEKLGKSGEEVPKTWADVLNLAKKGKVICGGNGTSLLMQLYMLNVTKSEDVFTEEKLADTELLVENLEEIRELFSYLDPIVYSKSPIGIYELLATSDREEAYCPCDFGYSNYSRRNYSKSLILSADTPLYHNGKQLKTILGGAGFAVSSHCKHKNEAALYAQFTASGQAQSSIYTESGGQPGHRDAWEDEICNQLTHNFFLNTLKTLDNAYLRPRHNGYLGFQEPACDLIHKVMENKGDLKDLAKKLNEMYVSSYQKKGGIA